MADTRKNDDLLDAEDSEPVIVIAEDGSVTETSVGPSPNPSDLGEIVVPERLYPWPTTLPASSFGNRSAQPNLLFRFALKLLKIARSEYEWYPIFKNSMESDNAFAELTMVRLSIERLWMDELGEPFTEPQLNLLREADCILVAVNPENRSIVCYGSGRYSRRGVIAGVDGRVLHAGHLVVATGHERKMLGPFIASVVGLYGQSLWEIFCRQMIVARSNNKYIEKIFKRAEPVYRSDLLDEANRSDAKLSRFIAALEYTHTTVFHYKDTLPLGRPCKILHHTPDEVRMPDLAPNETTYLARESSLAYYLWKVLTVDIRRSLLRALGVRRKRVTQPALVSQPEPPAQPAQLSQSQSKLDKAL